MNQKLLVLKNYILTHKRQTAVGLGIAAVVIFIGVVVYRYLTLPVVKTTRPFSQLTYNTLNSAPKKVTFKNLSKDWKEVKGKAFVYSSYDQPLKGLTDGSTLESLIANLGFTEEGRNYTSNEVVTWSQGGRSLNISMIGSRATFSIGLNVEKQYLETKRNLYNLEETAQTAKFFLEQNKLVPEYSLASPIINYSKMGELGLIEVASQDEAQVTTFSYPVKIDGILVDKSILQPSVSLNLDNHILAFSLVNKHLTQGKRYPTLEKSDLTEAIKENKLIFMSPIPEEFKSPDEIEITKTALLYFYNDNTQMISPVYKFDSVLKAGDKEKKITFYLPALPEKYYN